MARSSLLASTVTRYISGCDVPGGVSQCIRKSRSLNEGSSDCPSSGQTAMPARTIAPEAKNAGRGARMIRGKSRLVASLQPSDERGFPLDRRPVQQDQAQRRRDGQGHHHGRQQRERIGERQRLEEGAGQPAHEEDRHHRQHDDQRRVDDRAADLERGFEDDGRGRFAAALLAVLAQAPDDVLDVDDGVVDDGAEGDDEAGQDHRVDRGPAEVEHEPRRHQRERDREEADQRHPPLEEEGAEDQHHEDGADEERHRQIVDRQLDEGRRAEDLMVDLDAGQAGPHLVERRLHPSGDLQRVGPGKLLDDEHQARAVVDDGVADEQRLFPQHVRHVAQADRAAVLRHDRHLGQIFRRDAGRDGPDVRSFGSGSR